jgi:hypothetical protein
LIALGALTRSDSEKREPKLEEIDGMGAISAALKSNLFALAPEPANR